MLKTILCTVLLIYIPLSYCQTDSVTIYIAKQRWHTGIIINISDMNPSVFPEIKQFFSSGYVDIGWGDNDFYRTPGFDLGLAIKALFYPTESVLRIENFTIGINKYIKLTDKAFGLRLPRKSFDRLCIFISSTFDKSSGSPEIVEQRYNGNVVFFKASGKYYIFNTCNTWAAKALAAAGLDVTSKLFLAEELFNELNDTPEAYRLK